MAENNGIHSLSESELNLFLTLIMALRIMASASKMKINPKNMFTVMKLGTIFEKGQSLVIYQHANRTDKFNKVLKC